MNIYFILLLLFIVFGESALFAQNRFGKSENVDWIAVKRLLYLEQYKNVPKLIQAL